jgi:hypothetical protein
MTYSSSISGDRPEELAHIHRLVAETPPPPPLWEGVEAAPAIPGWGPNEQRAALGLRPEPELVATMTEPVDSERWIAKGCLRPNTMMLIVGSRGDRKSHLRKDMEFALATGGIGGPLWGAFDVLSGPLRVLVLDEDNGPPEEYRRDQEHLASRGLVREQLTNLWRLSWSGLLLERPTDQAWLVDIVERIGIEVLVLDPLGQFYGVAERREDMMPVVKFLRGLLRRFPSLTIVLVHHVRKPGANVKARTGLSLDDVRGAEWADRADVVALVSSLGEGRVKVELTKRVPPTTVILQHEDGGGLRLVSMGETTAEKTSTDDRVIGCIDAGAQSVAEVQVALHLSERTVWTSVGRLRKAGILEPGNPLRRPSEDR